MKSTVKKLAYGAAIGIAGTVAFAPGVSAQATQPPATAARTYQANLVQQNRSGASGTATVTVNGNNVTVNIRSTGLSPNLAHAQHIHIGGQSTCPAPTADTNKDGFVDSKEGEAAVGPIRVSLTTTGDQAAGSALAVDRYPKADAQGNLIYSRTFTLPAGVAVADLSRGVIEQHGISSLFNDKAKYDGDKKSELDNRLPFETTASATCGKLTAAPVGGLATGIGSTDGIESPALLAFGVISLAGAVALAVYSRRPVSLVTSGRF
jgi:hypothetical protein